MDIHAVDLASYQTRPRYEL